jgi:hypothetical protein
MKWIVAIALLVSVPAFAADDALAKRLYRQASEAYEARHWDEALDLFRQARTASPRPALLFNIAQCERQLGRYGDAEGDYRAFLRDGQPPPAVRARVEKLIAQMPTPPAPTAPSPPKEVAAPAPEMISPAPPASPPAAARPAQSGVANLPPVPVAVAANRKPAGPAHRNAAGWALLGVGGAIAVVGSGLIIHGEQLDSRIPQAGSLVEAHELAVGRDGNRTAGFVLLSVGGASILTGSVLLIVGRSRQQASRSSYFAVSTIQGAAAGGVR